MAELASQREKIAKQTMKKTHDKHAKHKQFDVGAMVLVRIPALTGKLEDSWEGPYEILDQVSPVNYQLAIPGGRKTTKILHVNMLKQWSSPEAHVLRVVVAEEDGDSPQEVKPLAKPTDSVLTPAQKSQLETIVLSFQDVVVAKPGKVSLLEHAINTADSPPLRTAQYRLAPAWKDQLTEEVCTLLEAGILRPSLSPWSSPILPIRKKDGTVRHVWISGV